MYSKFLPHVNSAGTRVVPQRGVFAFRETRIPRCGKRNWRGVRHGGNSRTQTCRPVREPHGFQANGWFSMRVPGADPAKQIYLFLQRKLGEHPVNLVFSGGVGRLLCFEGKCQDHEGKAADR
jgi:hypothetical protein